ncbi:24977_t:CDS:2, partial [Cetraspora pellucida]
MNLTNYCQNQKKNQEISDSTVQTTIDSHLAHQYTLPEKKNWEKLVLDATVANDPNLELPSQYALGRRILKVEVQQLNSIQKEKVIKDIVGVTVAFDGWKNINKKSIFGKILITSNGEVLIWGVEDITKYVILEDGKLSLSEVVCKPVGDPDFWSTIVELQLLLAPICNCLNQLQKDTSKLYDVLHTFGYLYEIMNKYSDYEFAELQEYHEESFPFTKSIWKQFNGDILKYWKHCAEIKPELGFNKILNSWFSLVDDEELAYDKFNEFECNVTFDEENINVEFIACETQHPADNCNAKWLLKNLFINNLPELSYVLAAKKREKEKKKKETEYLHQIAEKNNQNSVIEIEENEINHSNENN